MAPAARAVPIAAGTRLVVPPIAAIVLALLLALVSGAGYAAEDAQRAAADAAEKWLALIDAERYADAWHEAATLFRQQVGLAQWTQAVNATRTPLGSMTSRRLIGANYATSLPGAPDGEYVVLQFETSFTRKKRAIETVTPMLDVGRWRVSGYYIR